MATHGHTPHVDEHADSWHHHSSEEGKPQAEHAGVVNTWTLVQSFVIITAAVVITIGVIVIYYQSYITKQKALAIETDTIAVPTRSLKADWSRQLGEYGPVGDKQGVYAIPVEQAMKKVVQQYNPAAK